MFFQHRSATFPGQNPVGSWFEYFSMVIFSLTLTAVPAGDPVPQAVVLAGNVGDVYLIKDLIEQQLDLKDLLGHVASSLAATKEFLSAESLDNTQSTVNDLPYLLRAPTSQEIKDLVNGTSNMLVSDSVSSLLGELPGFLDSAKPLTPLKLILKLIDILDNALALLTPEFVRNTQELGNDVTPLVSAASQVISAVLFARGL
ncbi:hypothetical protein RU639_004414 [Aspergillus parasiticus]